ncbi:MAG TPA: hypothetical protein VFO98_12395, partial [Marmoricola sp.]|nr:hypothetical protein [Marmoricola sp.]
FTKELGGADISWIIGLVVPAVIYYLWASRRNVAPDRMIRATDPVAPGPLAAVDDVEEPAGH